MPVDILCKDNHRNTVVIEISACSTGLEEIGAMVNCMGTVAAGDNAPVRGILIAKEFSEATVNSARVVKELQLVRYKPRYELERGREK